MILFSGELYPCIRNRIGDWHLDSVPVWQVLLKTWDWRSESLYPGRLPQGPSNKVGRGVSRSDHMEGRPLAPLLLTVLFLATRASDDDHSLQTHQVSTAQCGEYSNQVLEDGMCRLMATLPQLDDQRCPDMFRCTDEVSYWLHENEERKQQILALRETVSELQEELRSHRHRVKVLELQVCGFCGLCFHDCWLSCYYFHIGRVI